MRKSRIVVLAAVLLAVGALSWLLMRKQEQRRADSSVPSQEIVYTGEEFCMDASLIK